MCFTSAKGRAGHGRCKVRDADCEQMLFFGSNCERLCMMQFALISLIPGLIRHLQDAADPKFNAKEKNLVMPTSLKTSERSSCELALRGGCTVN